MARGASTGEGLGNAFLSHIRETDAIAMVVRCFESDDVTHVEGHPDPRRDSEIVAIELALADLATMRKRIAKLEREIRAQPNLRPYLEAAQRLSEALEEARPARSFAPGTLEAQVAADSFLLTPNRCSTLLTWTSANRGPRASRSVAVRGDRAARRAAEPSCSAASSRPSSPACPRPRRPSFGASSGLERSGLDDLSAAAYDLLGLMTFLTAGEKEARAWPIPKGTKAPRAAGTIHSDLERGFIRAEIVSYDDYVQYRTMEALRAAGRMRSEGREYVMQEGDVVNFRFNV